MLHTIAVSEHSASADMAIKIVPFYPATRAFIQVPCAGLTGALDGVVTVYGITAGHKSIVGEIVLDAADNDDDVHSLDFTGCPEELGYEYTANGCNGGALSIIMSKDKL